MIIIRLDRVLADRKMRLNELAALVGISNVNLSYLKTGKVRAVRFSTLNAICKALHWKMMRRKLRRRMPRCNGSSGPMEGPLFRLQSFQ